MVKGRSLAQIIILFFTMHFVAACATPNTFEVKSEPIQAEVFIFNDKNVKKTIGKTPLSIPDTELRKLVGPGISSGEFFMVSVEKEGFLPQTFNIPASQYGTTLTSLKVKLKQGEVQKELNTAKEILDHLFLAQKLATTQQFERAQIELDKIIKPFPNFARALSMRASIYYAQKNYSESMKWYEEALRYDPEMEEAVKMLAKVRTLQGGNPSFKSNRDKK